MSRALSFPLALLAFIVVLNGQAQVFIPHQLERDWLNSEIPGIVDVNGIMDTLHPEIVELDSAVFEILSPFSNISLELHGLRYLDSLRTFWFRKDEYPGPDSLSITGLPSALDRLWITIGEGHLALPAMPTRMDELYVNNPVILGSVSIHIDQLPDTLSIARIKGASELRWNGSGHIESLSLIMEPSNTSSLYLPPVTTDVLGLDGDWVAIGPDQVYDFSAVTARSVFGTSISLYGTLLWPDLVENIMLFPANIHGTLGPFPTTLTSLSISSYTDFCLPQLPDGITSLQFDQTPSCIPNWPAALQSCMCPFGNQQSTANYCSVLNSNCPGANPGIAGRVFRDLDNNGQHDAGEPGLPHASVALQPNGNMAGCLPDGTWEIGVLPGQYTITAASGYPYIQSLTPATHSADVSLMGSVDTDNDFAVTLLPDVQDLRVQVSATPPRPGFDNRVYLRCENYGTTEVDATLTLTLDADQTWLGSSVAPSTTNGNIATWTFPAMPIGAVESITVDLNTAPSVTLGTAIIHTVTADPISSDETPLNNTYTFTDSVVGSYDPNDKLLTPSVLSPTEVAQGGTPIEYTIRFQNTGTYLAERVVILDTLSENLQWESMRYIASSHANHWYITDGVLHVIHNDIMLPDSTSDEPASHGFVKFSMLPKTHLQDGATISNIAHIVFDLNEPIITAPAVFSVDIEAGLVVRTNEPRLRLSPNPAIDRIQMRHQGTAAVRYRIIDVLGAQVGSGTTSPNGWVDVGTLQAAPYLMEVEQNGLRTSQRFVKQ